jgi:hypothetical protein
MAASLLIVLRTYVFGHGSMNQVLINASSVAIWNGNKVVVALTIVVWVTSIAFHLRSKFLPLAPVVNPV